MQAVLNESECRAQYSKLGYAERESFPTKTLTELGFKSSKAAQDAGFICVQPYESKGSRSFAGKWITAEQAPALAQAYHNYCDRQAAWEIEYQKRETEKLEKQLTAQFPKVATALMAETGLKRKDVKALLDEPLLRALAGAKLRSIALVPALAAFRDWTWREAKFDTKENCYFADSIPVRIKDEKAVRALLENNEKALLTYLDEEFEASLIALKEEAEKWRRSRPEWFDPAVLDSYARKKLFGEQQIEHPLQCIPLVKNTFKDRRHSLEFEGHKTCGLTDASQAYARLWEVKSLPEGNSLVVRADKIAKEVLLGKLQTLKSSFLAACQERFPVYEPYFEKAAWIETLNLSFRTALGTNISTDYQQDRALTLVSRAIEKATDAYRARECFSDLPSSVKDFYPLARSLNRKVTFYMGPTNSGKTHRALTALAQAPSGVYLGPLRLLALEVHDRLTEAGVSTRLVTGEQVLELDDARHTSSTIEMLDIHTPVEVAVVDEVQMLDDRQRGAAWLQAVLGAPAKHLILAGSESALPALTTLMELTGEDLEVVPLTRLSPLKVRNNPTSLSGVEPGTALVVFSRKEALGLAEHIRTNLKKSVAVVYGALSPDVRKEQARLFRSGEAQVLVATDAIAMGLNLPIKTVLFTTKEKWNGHQVQKIPASLTRQIAGRAGRYGLQEHGSVGALNSATLRHVRSTLSQHLFCNKVKLFVPFNLQIAQTIAKHTGTSKVEAALRYFRTYLKLEPWALPHVTPAQFTASEYLDRYDLSLEDKVKLLNAPAWSSKRLSPNFAHMVRCVESGKVESLDLFDQAKTWSLEKLESRVQELTLYCWMHYRFPELFPRINQARELSEQLNEGISEALKKLVAKRCNSCYKPLAWNFAFSTCASCHNSRWRRDHDDEAEEDDFDDF